MKVTLCSAFRNASGYVEQYLARVSRLAHALDQRGDCLHCIWCEGDSHDDTYAKLEAGIAADLFHFDHGGPLFGSVVDAQRFRQLARVWNRIWTRIPEDADAVVFLESDLLWDAPTLLTLLDCLDRYPAIAPMTFLPRLGANFYYDCWAHRKDGVMLAQQPPYFEGWVEGMTEPVPMNSAGSCLVMRGNVARQLRWPEEDVVVGICRQIYEHGGSVWLHPQMRVNHP